MNETKQFPKRIQDILNGLELRSGKKKVQTKEDLKKVFRKNVLMPIPQKRMASQDCIVETT